MIPSGAEIIASLATIAAVIVCVMIHYEGLSRYSHWLTFDLFQPRARIALLVFGLLLLHLAEIWVFALTYATLTGYPDFGTLLHSGYDQMLIERPMSLFDHAYYSATVYTTLGFGDIVPVGAVRVLTGT